VSGNRADDGPDLDTQDQQDVGSVFDTSVAHPARVYDYWLGGKDNYDADRSAAEAIIAVRPAIVRDIRANRDFMRRREPPAISTNSLIIPPWWKPGGSRGWHCSACSDAGL